MPNVSTPVLSRNGLEALNGRLSSQLNRLNGSETFRYLEIRRIKVTINGIIVLLNDMVSLHSNKTLRYLGGDKLFLASALSLQLQNIISRKNLKNH
jgi:hypothetical protein